MSLQKLLFEKCYCVNLILSPVYLNQKFFLADDDPGKDLFSKEFSDQLGSLNDFEHSAVKKDVELNLLEVYSTVKVRKKGHVRP